MDLERLFSAADREAIRAAAAGAEGDTGGEVVPYAVGHCDPYQGSCWKGAALAAVAVALAVGPVHAGGGFWGGGGWSWVALPVALAALAGYVLVAAVPGLRRALTPAALIDRRVELRAAAAFVEEEVFATRERTGVLIFLALFEHRVLVLADAGINAKVEQTEWDTIANRLAAALKAGQAAQGLVDAIGECGRLLARRGVERRPDDDNELPDGLRIRSD